MYATNKKENLQNNVVWFPGTSNQDNHKEPKLKKDGTPKQIVHNKEKGRKSEVYNYTVEDAKKMLDYFVKNEQWIHYLVFVLSCNLARRNSDIRSLTWENFFNPATGEFRKDMKEFNEQKTGKSANPHINSAVRDAIRLYLEKTGCDPSTNNYKEPILMQLSGTHKGTVMSYDGCRKAIKKAAEEVGIEYNVGTHSARKTFGATTKMLHPGDYDAMELLQTIYNHSDQNTTKSYIGITKEKVDTYYEDYGDFFERYVTGDATFQEISDQPVISLDINDLRNIISVAYQMGRDNSDREDLSVHMDMFNRLMKMVDECKK